MHTNRKDDIFMQRGLGQIFTCILERGQGTCKKSRSYPAQAYTTLAVLFNTNIDFKARLIGPHYLTGDNCDRNISNHSENISPGNNNFWCH